MTRVYVFVPILLKMDLKGRIAHIETLEYKPFISNLNRLSSYRQIDDKYTVRKFVPTPPPPTLPRFASIGKIAIGFDCI